MKKLFKVEIDLSLCKRCGICVYICPKNVFYIDEDIKVKEGNCSGCSTCEIICPDLAIKVEREDERADRR